MTTDPTEEQYQRLLADVETQQMRGWVFTNALQTAIDGNQARKQHLADLLRTTTDDDDAPSAA